MPSGCRPLTWCTRNTSAQAPRPPSTPPMSTSLDGPSSCVTASILHNRREEVQVSCHTHGHTHPCKWCKHFCAAWPNAFHAAPRPTQLVPHRGESAP